MNLQTTIRRILREESKKDLSPIIEKLLNGLVKYNQDIICGVKVTHPSNRVKLPEHMYEHEHYNVEITFIGGYGTDFWSQTQAVQSRYIDLQHETWNTVYDYMGISVGLSSKFIKECNNMDSQEMV